MKDGVHLLAQGSLPSPSRGAEWQGGLGVRAPPPDPLHHRLSRGTRWHEVVVRASTDNTPPDQPAQIGFGDFSRTDEVLARKWRNSEQERRMAKAVNSRDSVSRSEARRDKGNRCQRDEANVTIAAGVLRELHAGKPFKYYSPVTY